MGCEQRIPAARSALILLAAGLIAGGCGTIGSSQREDSGAAAGRLGSGLTGLMSKKSAEPSYPKPGKGKKQKEEKGPKGRQSEEPPPGRARERARHAEEPAPRDSGVVIATGAEYSATDDSDEAIEAVAVDAGIFSYDRTDFAVLVHAGTFSRDLGSEDPPDFDAGEFRGLEGSILLRNEFGPELAFGVLYERLETGTRVDLLSDGPLVMEPILLKGEYSNVVPGCRRFRFAIGLGLGLSLNDHELSDEAQADCAALGYACSEDVGTGFAVDVYVGPRYRLASWLEGQAMFGLAGSTQSVKFKTVDLATGAVQRGKSNIEFEWAYASLGLRVLF